VGIRSGHCDGHDSWLISSALSKLIAVLDVCLGVIVWLDKSSLCAGNSGSNTQASKVGTKELSDVQMY